jgi:predicted dehydrogenase
MRIGVIGLGFMGSTHLQAIARIPGAELAAVMDLDERRLAGDLSGVHGNLGGPSQVFDFSGVRRYRTVEEIAADGDVEAVDICLPTWLHAPAAIQMLRAGKHVLVEKPMALEAASCDAMISEARRANRILMTAQVLRFAPAYQALRKYVSDGSIGVLRSAIFRRRCAVPGWGPWEMDPAKSGGGIFDLLIHDVDMCLHLFGPPEAVSTTGHEDMAHGLDQILAQLHYPGAGFVAVTGGWHHAGSYPFSMEFTVAGNGGVAEYSSAGRPATLYRSDGTVEAPIPEEMDFYQAEIEYFLECCRRGAQPELCRPEDSAQAVRLTLLMLESRRRNGERLAFAG